MTSSTVRGWSAGRGAAAATLLPIPVETSTRIATASLRISLLPLSDASVSQPKLNAHASRKIDRLAISLRRFELYLLRGPHRSLIEAVAESADDPIHLHSTVCLEDHVEYYITLESKITPFRGVLRTWLVQNVNHGRGRIAGRRFLLR